MDKVLKILLDNYKVNKSDIFKASNYWRVKNESIIEELKKKNIKNFNEFKKIFSDFKFKLIKYQRLDNLSEDVLLINH